MKGKPKFRVGQVVWSECADAYVRIVRLYSDPQDDIEMAEYNGRDFDLDSDQNAGVSFDSLRPLTLRERGERKEKKA